MVLIRVSTEPLFWLQVDAKEKENDKTPPFAKYLPSRNIYAQLYTELELNGKGGKKKKTQQAITSSHSLQSILVYKSSY